MTTIIGIDPGSRKTGYGVIQVKGNQTIHLTHGCLALNGATLAERLQQIFIGLRDIIQQYQPHEAAIEQVFMHANVSSALKLGHARGAALVAIGIPIVEYSARVIKQAIVGYGAAPKEQVQQMVKRFLNLQAKIQSDASDALAIALCHAHSRTMLARLEQLQKK
jgi:crossover junction endodeoxyribonuclease RuvC